MTELLVRSAPQFEDPPVASLVVESKLIGGS